MPIKRVKTPCIGICSTGIGDNVCRGCKRFTHEVIDWNGYRDEQKQIIDARLENFLTQVVQTRLEIIDSELLQWQIQVQQIDVKTHRNEYCQLYDFVKAGASQIRDPADYGFRILANSDTLDLKQICSAIDQEFYILSDAHYQRYFLDGVLAVKAVEEALESVQAL